MIDTRIRHGLLLSVVVAVCGCSLDTAIPNSQLVCDPTKSECPSGYSCVTAGVSSVCCKGGDCGPALASSPPDGGGDLADDAPVIGIGRDSDGGSVSDLASMALPTFADASAREDVTGELDSAGREAIPTSDGPGLDAPVSLDLPGPNPDLQSDSGCGSVAGCKCAGSKDCAGGMVCDVASGTCRPPGKPNGQACAAGTECSSGNCADKVCCDLACTGVCRACLMAQTGKPDGTCANVVAGSKDTRCTPQDPSTCGRDGACDGSGQCRNFANGTRCGSGCCRDGAGLEARVCAFECNNGTCDRNRPTVLDRCGGIQCCCPGAMGGPACTMAPSCAGGCAQ
jgi:hypothetical protein